MGDHAGPAVAQRNEALHRAFEDERVPTFELEVGPHALVEQCVRNVLGLDVEADDPLVLVAVADDAAILAGLTFFSRDL